MDHAKVWPLQVMGFAAIVYGSIPFLILSFFRIRWANRVTNLFGLAVLFYVTIGQALWCLPFYGTHWDFSGAKLLADGVTCPDGCRADAITLAIRNHGSPTLALMTGALVFLAFMSVPFRLTPWDIWRRLDR
jgi:hypothetical protein